jgi:hypothetical protein
MKYIKLFENYFNDKIHEYNMNNNIYRITIFDDKKKNEEPMRGLITTVTTSSNKNEYDLRDEFLNSDGYLSIKKNNPNAELIVKVSKLDSSTLIQ